MLTRGHDKELIKTAKVASDERKKDPNGNILLFLQTHALVGTRADRANVAGGGRVI